MERSRPVPWLTPTSSASGPPSLSPSSDDGDTREVFLGEDLLEWIVLALGAAMFVGNLGAVLRPRGEQREGDLVRAPVGRSVLMAGVGFVAGIWALASLVT